MEFTDYQEFAAQDFLAVNSQNTFSLDTATIPGSNIGDEAFGEQIDLYSRVFISEERLDEFWNSDSEVMPLQRDRHSTINVFSHGSAKHLQLENEELNFDLDTLDNYQSSLTGSHKSLHTKDVLMSGNEIGRVQNGDFEPLDSLTEANCSSDERESLLKNSGFDLALDGTNWLIGKTGKVREYDRNVESVAYIDNVAGQGRQIYLKLPEEAKINYEDQLSLFQDVSGLERDKVYAVEARVKWLNPENNLPSAIVSFWAQNPDGTFRGQDFVITDGDDYKTLRFEYTPSQTGTTRFFLGLFTHINGNTDDTEIYVDDYKVTEIDSLSEGLDSREGNLLSDGGFDRYKAQPQANPSRKDWFYTVESPVPGLEQSISTANGNKKLRLELPKAENNKDEFNTSVTGVYQNVELVGGQTYQLSADFHRIELDRFAAYENSIVQFMMYRKLTDGQELFLGPIDVELKDNDLQSKNFDVIAPESGNYTILVRLAGWGNEGNGVVVEVDNVSVVANQKFVKMNANP